MESLNLNTLAHSLPNANNLAISEKDLLNNFKGENRPMIIYQGPKTESFTPNSACSGRSEYNDALSLLTSDI